MGKFNLKNVETESFIDFLKPYTRTVQIIEQGNRNAIRIHIDNEFRRRYFAKRFEDARKMMSEMELDDFCSDSFELDLLRTEVEDGTLMVYSEDFGYKTFDSFVRSAEAEDYIVQDAVILH